MADTPALRARIVAAAVDMTAADGWSSITMGRLAERVGVSRQTVYTEVGGKAALAEAMVLDQLARFLAVVDAAFDRAPDEPVTAIRTAVRDVLEMARTHALLQEIVASSHGAGSDLLPLITTRSESLVAIATSTLSARLAPHARHLTHRQSTATVDGIVRTVLSHVMLPGAEPRVAADGIAWMAGRLLAAPA